MAFLSFYPTDSKTYTQMFIEHTKTHAEMFIEALFIIITNENNKLVL